MVFFQTRLQCAYSRGNLHGSGLVIFLDVSKVDSIYITSLVSSFKFMLKLGVYFSINGASIFKARF